MNARYLQGGGGDGEACDVAVFAHGHLLRAFVKRWLKYPMEFPLSMVLDAGAVGVLRCDFFIFFFHFFLPV